MLVDQPFGGGQEGNADAVVIVRMSTINWPEIEITVTDRKRKLFLGLETNRRSKALAGESRHIEGSEGGLAASDRNGKARSPAAESADVFIDCAGDKGDAGGLGFGIGREVGFADIQKADRPR